MPESTPWAALVKIVTESAHSAFPVVNNSGRVVGLLSPRQVRGALHDPSLAGLTLAADLCWAFSRAREPSGLAELDPSLGCFTERRLFVLKGR